MTDTQTWLIVVALIVIAVVQLLTFLGIHR